MGSDANGLDHRWRLLIGAEHHQDQAVVGVGVPLGGGEGVVRTFSAGMAARRKDGESGQMRQAMQGVFDLFQTVRLHNGDDLFHDDLLVVVAGAGFAQIGLDQEAVLRGVLLTRVEPADDFGEFAVAAPQLHGPRF